MNCPICDVELVVVERDKIELDWCPKCSGFWFDADGAIVGWGDASFFVEPSYNDNEEFQGLATGIHPDHAQAGSYTATFRVADLESMKHVTCTLTITVTE